MAEMRVTIDGTFNPATGLITPGVTTVPGNSTPGTADFTKLTDGSNVVTISSSGVVGNALATSTGSVFSGATLAAVTGNSTGTTVDAGSARSNWSAVAVGTATLTGTLTLELSLDNVSFVSSTATVALTAAATVGVFSTGRPARYARVSFSASAGAGSVTVNMMAA